MPTFMANTWTESIAMADGSPPLTMLLAVCISARLVFTVLEQAAEVRWRALVTCMNVIGYKAVVLCLLDRGWWRWPSSAVRLPLSPHQHTSFNKSNTAFGAGLISVGTKELSSEQQGHTGVDAATRSTAQLVQAS
eukprot:Em0006g1488a